jgi:UDP-N-acetylglucosamine diphosphorylase / glucose-1-phosphate thymidylyltransferase / UDP-N-acetylgalactosamine diphosphorylase / glucosamine-1-phosphate N-acetyltransferase / galactosamine-1-phosphate N-acetyltransferase
MDQAELLRYVAGAQRFRADLAHGPAWQAIGQIDRLVRLALPVLGDDFRLAGRQIAVHRTAAVAGSAEISGPAIIGPGSRVGPGAVLRAGVWTDELVTIGPHSEIKASLMFARSAAAHRNYVGDSIVGADVNLEAGAVLANHFNERADKSILVLVAGKAVATGLVKFGAVVGDGCRIGANAVTSPGTLLPAGTVVPRLALVDQLAPGEPRELPATAPSHPGPARESRA